MHGFYDQQPKMNKVIMNGPRPSPLMINKDSHLIRKLPISQKVQHKGPIIIYTESPKIIHTKPQDFMALVQRLTGSSSRTRSTTKETITAPPQPFENFGSLYSNLSDEDENSKSNIKKEEEINVQWMQHGASDDEITSECETACVNKDAGGGANSNNFNFADMPLFTPTSYDFFCSPSRPLPFGILGSLISPSGLGFIKDLPEFD